jgi:hypothetical protein
MALTPTKEGVRKGWILALSQIKSPTANSRREVEEVDVEDVKVDDVEVDEVCDVVEVDDVELVEVVTVVYNSIKARRKEIEYPMYSQDKGHYCMIECLHDQTQTDSPPPQTLLPE